MIFFELILIGIVFYFINSSSRKKETRLLQEQIRGLENVVRGLAAHVASMRPAGYDTAFIPDDVPEEAARDVAEAPATEAAMTAVAEKIVKPEETPEERALSEARMAGLAEHGHAGTLPTEGAGTESARETAAFAEDEAPLPETSALPDGASPEYPFFADDAFKEEEFAYAGSVEESEDSSGRAVSGPAEAEPRVPEYLQAFVGFIRGGNIWVAGGVIMLLLGFAFLAQLGIFPIELRIVGAALAGMAMVGFGLYIRDRRRMYALIMQGGGIGVLYLSAFASAKLTDMLPPAAALAVMTALIIPAVALAVVQNAQVLALFGFVGGFAAPILLSDGSGNYVALFSCYTLLNLGILAICRYRLWRWLNFSGALCTFVVMGAWGIRSYDASMFGTTEPFLLVFALIYIAITLGSVRRAEFSFREPLDAIPACAIPFLAALFQWRIAMDIPHGLSISAVVFGAFFILLAICVWKLWGDRTRLLAEFYLANGVVLANLAVPLELSGYVTSTVWAVEGAMLFFFACRIGSPRIKIVALLLQVVGMAAFFWDITFDGGHTLLSTGLISLAALSSACFHKLDADDPRRETPEAINAWLGDMRLERLLAVAGLVWWYGGLALETWRFADQPLVTFFLAASVSSVALFVAEKMTGIREFLPAAIGVPLAAAAWGLLAFSGGDYLHRSAVTLPSSYSFSAWNALEHEARLLLRHNFLTGWSALAWAAFAVTQVGLLRFCLSRVKPSRHAWWAGVLALELLLMLTSSGRGAALDLGLSPAWGHLASIFPALAYTAALAWILRRYTEGRAALLTRDHTRILGGTVPAILFVPLGAWLFLSFFNLGKAAPLPFHVPLLNPLELKQALCIATFALWQRAISQVDGIRFTLPLPRLLLVLDALLFIWLHSMVFRGIAHFTGTPMGRAWEHESFQVLLTILWGVWGMSHLILGNRKRIRSLWGLGASLMLADTAKLFLVDLADKGTLFRVISFFVMGGIFLLIGWLAPLPPSNGKGGQDAGPDENTDATTAKESVHAADT